MDKNKEKSKSNRVSDHERDSYSPTRQEKKRTGTVRQTEARNTDPKRSNTISRTYDSPSPEQNESLKQILSDEWGLTVRLVTVTIAVGVFYFIAAMILSWPFSEETSGLTGIILGVALSFLLALILYRRDLKTLINNESVYEYSVNENPQLHNKVDKWSGWLGISRPTLMRKETDVVNAYAAGRAGNGYVIVSDQLIKTLSQDELEAVVAHELSHIKHRGSILAVLMTTSRTVIRCATMLLIGLLVVPILMLQGESGRPMRNIQRYKNSLKHGYTGAVVKKTASIASGFVLIFERAFSRHREFLADRRAASIIGSQRPMVGALKSVEESRDHRDRIKESGVPLSICIHGRVQSSLGSLFKTHPSIEKRIERLQRGFGDSELYSREEYRENYQDNK